MQFLARIVDTSGVFYLNFCSMNWSSSLLLGQKCKIHPASIKSLDPWPCHASQRFLTEYTELLSKKKKKLKTWDANSVPTTPALCWASNSPIPPQDLCMCRSRHLKHPSLQSSWLTPSLLAGYLQNVILSKRASLTTLFNIVHMHIHTHSHMLAHLHSHVHISTWTQPHTCVCTRSPHVHMCTNTHSIMPTLTYIYAHLLTFTHLHFPSWQSSLPGNGAKF